ncbi:MAG: SGNH/GDSL hydrolase family protein [Phycisphaerales bacterium]
MNAQQKPADFPSASPCLRILRDIHRLSLINGLILLSLFTTACTTQNTKDELAARTIDPDKAAAAEDSKLLWFDALDLGIEGQGWPIAELKHPYERFPARAEGVVRDAVWNLSENSAGLSIRFVTDSPVIAARWSLRSAMLDMHHMPSTGVSGVDLYAKDDKGQWRWVGAGRPKTQELSEWTLVSQAPPGEHEYQLYLPLYNGIEKLEIGLAQNTTLRKAPPYDKAHAKPILFWGTSILQGGCASRPGMAYPSIIGRRLHRPTINLGFSGNGKMDPEIAMMIGELDVAAYVIDCGPNMTAEMVAERTEPLVRTIRAAQPKTPIVLIENIRYQHGWFIESTRNAYQSKNAQLKAAYERLQKRGVRNLYYIPCDNLLGNDGEATVDGTHATDLGFMRMADVIAPELAKILK